MKANSVCAVVVTYNRKELLRECLQALLGQSHAVDHILVVDNASSDGTAGLVRQEFSPTEFPQIELVTLQKNGGGAGGFHQGIKRAAAAGYEWLWLMDDDTIPTADALEELFTTRARFPENNRPDLLASKALWTDGTLHFMNSCWVDLRHPELTYLTAQLGTLPVRTATFVSLLIRGEFVERYGLPIADYFIWGDDTEYTGRILRDNLGVAVPGSVVVHKTPFNHASADPSPRFYYHVRNTLWIVLRSPAFNFRDKVSLLWQLTRAVVQHFRGGLTDLDRWRITLRGIWDGAVSRPAPLGFRRACDQLPMRDRAAR